MKEKLTKLYNTLSQIETKGENTKLMAACLNYTIQLMAELDMPSSPETNDVPVGGD